MDSTKRAIKFQLNEGKVSILTFWIVIIIVDMFAVLMSRIADVSIGLSEISIGINNNGYGQGLSILSLMAINFIPIIIYYITYSFELYYKNFPISLSFSVTRKDFFKSMTINNILVAFIASIIQSLLMKIDPILVRTIGKEPYYEFGLFNTQTDSILFIMISIFIISIVFIAIWNLIALLFYKFGPKLWIVLGVIFALIPPIQRRVLRGYLIFPVDWLNVRIDILQFTIFLIITILLYVAIYFITINTNIKNKA